MGFRSGAYATVWEVRNGNGNWTDVKLSISKKSRQTGEYETDFSGYVRFIGDAASKATYLGDRARIKIGECEVTNHYNKEKGVTYTNFAVFSFEEVNSNGSAGGESRQNSSDGFMTYPDDDGDLPFN